MPKVINAENLLMRKEKLPTEAFFVDTNTIIYLNDPFGESENNELVAELNPKLERLFNYLSNHHCKCYCTLEVCFEYYNHIRYGTLKSYKKLKTNVSYRDFKNLRKTDDEFKELWDKRIRKFKRSFNKRFRLFGTKINFESLINRYDSQSDFIDHVLYNSVNSLPSKLQCLLTYDEDFYAYPDDYYLLTFNPKIIAKAEADSKLYI